MAALVSLLGTQEELRWNAALKIAEFRQAWINDLRDSMSAFQSIAIGPNAVNNPDLYRFGTKIELLMNRRDGRYDELNEAMYAFLRTNTMAERWACNPAFVTVSQNILKEEWEVLKRDLKSKQTKKTLSR